MSDRRSEPWWDLDWWDTMLTKHKSTAGIARAIEVPRQTIGAAKRALEEEHGIKLGLVQGQHAPTGRAQKAKAPRPLPAGGRITKHGATLTSNATTVGISPDKLLKYHHLDPDEWSVPELYPNTWEGPGSDGTMWTFHQLKIKAVRRLDLTDMLMPVPAREPGWQAPPIVPVVAGADPYHIMVLPDPHCPLEEPTLMAGALELARLLQPREILWIGDGLDASAFMRHAKTRRDLLQPFNHCTHRFYHHLFNFRQACPNTIMRIVVGNHDWWLRRRLMDRLPDAVDITVAGTNDEIHSLEHILRLDEIRVEIDEPLGEYHDATHTILPDLVGLHGVKGGKYGGAAAEFETWEGSSVIQGHDHKTALVAITKRLPDNTEVTRYAISVGTMARRDLGYDHRRNVNQSFGVFTVHPDGRWHPDLALYDPQRDDVTWRDWRHAA